MDGEVGLRIGVKTQDITIIEVKNHFQKPGSRTVFKNQGQEASEVRDLMQIENLRVIKLSRNTKSVYVAQKVQVWRLARITHPK